MSETSTKPYLIRAIYEWCTDNGFTPYIAVFVDGNTSVPREFVKNNEIVLNVSFDATSGLEMGNEWIAFSARFGGVSRKIECPWKTCWRSTRGKTARAWRSRWNAVSPKPRLRRSGRTTRRRSCLGRRDTPAPVTAEEGASGRRPDAAARAAHRRQKPS
jgi:stringent starvation protein B